LSGVSSIVKLDFRRPLARLGGHLGNLARLRRFGFASLILTAGMHRSGSTLLYNVVRLCLQQHHGARAICGWIDSLERDPEAAVYLAKIHRVRRSLAWRARSVFFTYRDVRSALVSANRKFGTELSTEFCRRQILEFERARKYADILLRYEDFSRDLPGTVHRVATTLGISVNADDVLTAIPPTGGPAVATAAHDVTLMHGTHGTGTGAADWRSHLSTDLQQQIRDEFGWWLEENGYDSL